MTSSVSYTSQPDTIQDRLSVFTKKFVEAVRKELKQSKQDGEVGSSPKPGQLASVIGPAAGTVWGGIAYAANPTLTSGSARATKTVLEYLYTKKEDDKIKQRCRKVVDTFRGTTTKDIIKILVDAGSALFESFEEPFMRVLGEPNAKTSWAQGMEKLACDAKDRLINSILKSESFTLSPENVFRAVLSGKSNNSCLMSHVMFLKSLKTDNIRGSLPGHSIIINNLRAGNQEQKTLKTSEVFEIFDLAVVSSDGQVEQVYSKVSKPCSLRRVHLFDHPNVLNDFVKQKEIVSHQYGLTRNILDSSSNEIYDTLRGKDPDVRSKDTLEEVKATRAVLDRTLKILTEKDIDKCLPRKELSLKAKEFLTLKVKLCGEETEVQAAFLTLAIEDIITLLENPAAEEEFEDWKSKSSALELDSALPDTSPLYIPRRISNRVELDPQVFKRDDSPDIFVFKGLSKDDVKALVAPLFVMSSTDQLNLITCRHIHLDDEEDWDDLVEIAKAPLHLISKEVLINTEFSWHDSTKEIFIIAKSTKVGPLIREACSKMPERRRDMYISEEQFVHQLQSENSICGACLCDVPGMGKSWLLQSLANTLKRRAPKTLVFFTSLSSFSEYLMKNDIEQNVDPLLSYLKFVYPSTWAAIFVHCYATRSQSPAYLFLDGYDEILGCHLERTASFLKSLYKNYTVVKIIISSRPHLRGTLESEFGVVAYDILPYDSAEQVLAMANIWKTKFVEHDLIKLEEYAAECVKITRRIKQRDYLDILGVPLKCFMIATVCEKNAGRYSSPNKKKTTQPVELAISYSVYDLYANFVDTQMNKASSALGIHSETEVSAWKQNMHSLHTLEALNTLFPEFSQIHLKKLRTTTSSVVQKVGLLQASGSAFIFSHRTMAEYFAGRFFADLWHDDCTDYDNIREASVHLFFKELLRSNVAEHRLVFEIRGFCYSKDIVLCKVYEFTEQTSVWFMENCLLSYGKSTSPEKLCKFANMLGKKSWNPFRASKKLPWKLRLEKYFGDNLYLILICCIRGGFLKILQLFVEIIRASSHKNYRATLFRSVSALSIYTKPSDGDMENAELIAVVALLDQCAKRGSEEITHEIFNLFTESENNYLLQIFQRSSPEFKHSFVSCALTDPYFEKSRNWFVSFLLEKKFVRASEAPIVSFSKAVADESKFPIEDELNFIAIWTARRKWDKIKSILLQNDINLNSTSLQYKAQLVEHAITLFCDSELVVVLVDLFGKEEESCNFFASENINTSDFRNHWKSDEVLEVIDINHAGHVFSAVKSDVSHSWFVKLRGLEILKVLLSIWKDMRNNALYNLDYLHWAVGNKNVEWVRYLLQNDHDINAIDEDGRTPIHLVRTGGPLKITELLLEHGADVYAVDVGKHNVVHFYYDPDWEREKSVIVEWTNFMLDRGHHKLWSMKNSFGKTPMDLLAEKYDVAFCNEIASLVKKYEALSQGQTISSK